MHPTLVLDVVGLTPSLIGAATPHLARFRERYAERTIDTITPAVTCSVQATYLTGLPVNGHGIVGNGWYFDELAEIWFWRQSNRLVSGEKLWEAARLRDASFSCANLFWWYNMYSSADIGVTPRPMYPADGRKLPDIYTRPASLRPSLQAQLGQFPLFDFWGPLSNIRSSRWIAEAARAVYEQHRPTLSLVYLPHLDYGLQRLGPDDPALASELSQIDTVIGELLEWAERAHLRIVILSEYGVTQVNGAVHINRALREAGLVRVRDELGKELLDPGASRAFAVADHQIAHVYVPNPEERDSVQKLISALDGVERVLDDEGKRALGLHHPRAGDLVALSRDDRWFSYYYWLDDERAPDFARTVDIHRKPGYDPVELFLDPRLRFPKLRIGAKLAARKLGFRNLLDVIALDANLVKGSHGRVTDDPRRGPVLLTNAPWLLGEEPRIPAENIKQLLLAHVFHD